ncbi:hypothetical protein CLV63_12919 [Murinocardiopsis flavida]|uniref:Uncharacterized protein n=1 Tax=Murinocardiopsis flavida TaxID=645275 RepID=A0A2P8CUU3_9ACTN|nr:hypothetical protein [Murinocardiopsis flavida]PSK88733.1 hypothetical protein CLV63_12919 [Murinocardiopsis flavida]
MSLDEPRPLAREISAFLTTLRHRTENRTLGVPPASGDADVLAWKSSLLDRIAAQTDDPETHQVAANARTQLDAARSAETRGGGL